MYLETSVNFYRMRRRHIPEDNTVLSDSCECVTLSSVHLYLSTLYIFIETRFVRPGHYQCSPKQMRPFIILTLHINPRSRGRKRIRKHEQRSNSDVFSHLDPATFQLVAECFNQLRYRLPPIMYVT
jgi:hypothetical protein